VKDKFLIRFSLLFLAGFAVITTAAVYALRTVNGAMAGSDWVNHSYAAIFQCEQIIASLQQADGLMRTSALTGDARDQATCREAFEELAEHFASAKALMRDQPEAVLMLGKLEARAREREALAQELFAARRAGQTERVTALLAGDSGFAALASVRLGLEKVRDAEFDQLTRRDHAAYLQAQSTRWVVGIGIAINFTLLGLGVWLLRDTLATRQRAAAQLQLANDRLEERVAERTAELQHTNAGLRAENLERRWLGASQDHQLRYHQLIVDSVDDLVLVITRAQNLTRINPAVVHVTGRNEEALLTRPLAEVVTVPLDPGSGLNPLDRALAEGRELRRLPAEVQGPGGRRIPARLTLVPLRDQDKVVGAVVVVRIALDDDSPGGARS